MVLYTFEESGACFFKVPDLYIYVNLDTNRPNVTEKSLQSKMCWAGFKIVGD